MYEIVYNMLYKCQFSQISGYFLVVNVLVFVYTTTRYSDILS